MKCEKLVLKINRSSLTQISWCPKSNQKNKFVGHRVEKEAYFTECLRLYLERIRFLTGTTQVAVRYPGEFHNFPGVTELCTEFDFLPRREGHVLHLYRNIYNIM